MKRVLVLGVVVGFAACSVPERPYGPATDVGGGGADGGDNGSGGSGAPDETPPTVVSAAPTGELLDGRSPIVVQFDENIEAPDDAITVLLDDTIDVPGAAVVEGDRLIFSPDDPFSDLGGYKVTVATSVTDTAGNALAEPYEFEFESLDQTTGSASSRLDSGLGAVVCPHVKMDEAGNASVLFSQDGTLYLARYRAGDTWEETLEIGDGEDGVLAVSRGGRIAVAYTTLIAGERTVVARISAAVDDSTLGAPIILDEGAAHEIVSSHQACTLQSQDKNVAINDDGDLAVVWRTFTATGGDPITGLTYNVKLTGEAIAVPTFASNYPFSSYSMQPAIVMDDAGNTQILAEGMGSFGDELRTISFNATTKSWIAPAYYLSSDVGALRAGLAGDGRFYFAAPFASAQLSLASAEFGGANAGPSQGLAVATPAEGPYLSTSGPAPWVAWRSGTSIGVMGVFDDFVDYNQSLATESGVTNPVVVGIDGTPSSTTRALTVWERNGALRWSLVTQGQFGLEGTSAATVNTDGSDGLSPRVAYDIPGRHGILVWIRDDGQLRATEFHRLPPSSL